jgi:hypothetical protein
MEHLMQTCFKGYLPMIKKSITNPRGFGARIRDRIKTKREDHLKQE